MTIIKKIFKFIIKILKILILFPIMCNLPEYKYDIDKMEKEIDEINK